MVIRTFLQKISPGARTAGIAALLLLLGITLSPIGCQEPIQPSGLTVPTDVTIKVEDGNGAPINGAWVEFVALEDGDGGLQLTDSRGEYRETELDVPVVGREYLLRVLAPFDDPELAGLTYLDTVRIPCRDTVMTVVFVRTVQITCGLTDEVERLSLSTCVDSTDLGSIAFVNSSGLPLEIVFGDLASSDVDVSVLRNGQSLTSPFSLGAGERFTVEALFAPLLENSSNTGQVTFEGRDPTGALCYQVTLEISSLTRPCDSAGVGICRIDEAESTILRDAPNDSIRARTDSRGSGTLCIENVGDGDLTVRASQVLNSPLFSIEPDELTIPPGESDCFTIIFSPTTSTVWPGGRGNEPARTRFFDSVFIDGCGATFELKGVADTTFPALINNCRTPYRYRDQRCGDRITENDQIITECDKDSTEFDWYVDVADPVARTGRMNTGTGVASFKFVRSNYVPPVATGFGCSDPAISAPAAAACEDAFGWTNFLNVSMGDVILFRKGGKCWILFINSINDANVENKPLLCYDICRLR